MIPVRPSPQPPLRGGFLPPSLWCGGIRGWVCLLWFPPSPLWHGVGGSGFLVVVTPCVFGSALGSWYTHPYDDDNDDGVMITIFIINSNILMFLWLVVGCLLPICLVTIIDLLIVGPLSS